MRPSRRLPLALLCVLAVAPHLPAQTEAEDGAALAASCRLVLEALRADDADALVAALPTEAELPAVFEALLGELPAAERERARAGFATDAALAAAREKGAATVRRRLERARRDAAAAIDWTRAELVGPLPVAEAPAPFAEVGYVMRDVEFIVHASGRLFSFGGRDVLRGPRGWVFMEGPTYRGEWRSGGASEDEVAALRSELDSLRELRDRDARLRDDELRDLRMRSEGELADLHARARDLELERDELAARLEDAVRESQRVREDLRRLELENSAFRAAIRRLERGTPAPVEGAVLPSWCGEVPDPALRAALLAPFPVEAAELPRLHVLEVLSIASGLETLALPSATDGIYDLAADGAGLSGDLSVADTLTLVFGAEQLALDATDVVVGGADEREAFRARRQAASLELPGLAGATVTGALSDVHVTDALRFVADAAGVALHLDAAAVEALESESVGLLCTRRLGVAEMLDLTLAAFDLHASVVEGVLVVGVEPLGALPALPAPVLERVAGLEPEASTPWTSLELVLFELGQAFGLSLGEAPDGELAGLEVGTFHGERFPARVALALLSRAVGDGYEWRVEGDGLALRAR